MDHCDGNGWISRLNDGTNVHWALPMNELVVMDSVNVLAYDLQAGLRAWPTLRCVLTPFRTKSGLCGNVFNAGSVQTLYQRISLLADDGRWVCVGPDKPQGTMRENDELANVLGEQGRQAGHPVEHEIRLTSKLCWFPLASGEAGGKLVWQDISFPTGLWCDDFLLVDREHYYQARFHRSGTGGAYPGLSLSTAFATAVAKGVEANNIKYVEESEIERCALLCKGVVPAFKSEYVDNHAASFILRALKECLQAKCASTPCPNKECQQMIPLTLAMEDPNRLGECRDMTCPGGFCPHGEGRNRPGLANEDGTGISHHICGMCFNFAGSGRLHEQSGEVNSHIQTCKYNPHTWSSETCKEVFGETVNQAFVRCQEEDGDANPTPEFNLLLAYYPHVDWKAIMLFAIMRRQIKDCVEDGRDNRTGRELRDVTSLELSSIYKSDTFNYVCRQLCSAELSDPSTDPLAVELVHYLWRAGLGVDLSVQCGDSGDGNRRLPRLSPASWPRTRHLAKSDRQPCESPLLGGSHLKLFTHTPVGNVAWLQEMGYTSDDLEWSSPHCEWNELSVPAFIEFLSRFSKIWMESELQAAEAMIQRSEMSEDPPTWSSMVPVYGRDVVPMFLKLGEEENLWRGHLDAAVTQILQGVGQQQEDPSLTDKVSRVTAIFRRSNVTMPVVWALVCARSLLTGQYASRFHQPGAILEQRLPPHNVLSLAGITDDEVSAWVHYALVCDQMYQGDVDDARVGLYSHMASELTSCLRESLLMLYELCGGGRVRSETDRTAMHAALARVKDLSSWSDHTRWTEKQGFICDDPPARRVSAPDTAGTTTGVGPVRGGGATQPHRGVVGQGESRRRRRRPTPPPRPPGESSQAFIGEGSSSDPVMLEEDISDANPIVPRSVRQRIGSIRLNPQWSAGEQLAVRGIRLGIASGDGNCAQRSVNCSVGYFTEREATDIGPLIQNRLVEQRARLVSRLQDLDAFVLPRLETSPNSRRLNVVRSTVRDLHRHLEVSDPSVFDYYRTFGAWRQDLANHGATPTFAAFMWALAADMQCPIVVMQPTVITGAGTGSTFHDPVCVYRALPPYMRPGWPINPEARDMWEGQNQGAFTYMPFAQVSTIDSEPH